MLQSEGIATGIWPGCMFNGDVNTQAWSNNDYSYKNIASDKYFYNSSYQYDRYGDLYSLYENIKDVEAVGGFNGNTYNINNERNGLYLVPKEYAQNNEFVSQALLKTVHDYGNWGSNYYAWLGSVYIYDNHVLAWYASGNTSSTEVWKTENTFQNRNYILAPAFNLDVSKVILNDNVITLK